MKRFWIPLMLCGVLATGDLAGGAQPGVAPMAGDLKAMLESLRSDVNGFKVRLLNDVMGLSNVEADKFWPIYRQYEKDMAALGDRRVEVIREFLALQEAGRMEDASWDSIARRSIANAESRLQLWKRYHKKIAKAVSPKRAAQFLQVEHQIALFVDLSIASEMPLAQ